MIDLVKVAALQRRIGELQRQIADMLDPSLAASTQVSLDDLDMQVRDIEQTVDVDRPVRHIR
jgi:hypothetical protein